MSDKYQYVKRLIIPNLLWNKIKDISETEQFKFAFIPSFIKTMVDDDNQYNNINIGRKVWLNAIGSEYRKYIDMLIKWDIISIQVNDNGTESYCVGGHCKCYSITKLANAFGFRVVDYYKRTPTTKTLAENVASNQIDTSDPIICYTLKSIQALVADNKTSQPASSMADESSKGIRDAYWLDKLTRNNYSIHYGKNCGRLYHPVICMSTAARSKVWFKDSETVVAYDIKSCFPVLLFKLVDDTEKSFYKKCLDNDIYKSIVKGSKHNRDKCKVAFQQFINGFVKTSFMIGSSNTCP